MFESGFNSTIANRQGSSAYGLCQWLGARRFRLTTQEAKKYDIKQAINLEDFADTFPPRLNVVQSEDKNQPGFLIAPSGTEKAIYSDFDIQLLFIKKELETGYRSTKDAIKKAKTVDEAVLIWLENYEGIPRLLKGGKPNPHWNQAYLPQRTAFANDFLKRMAFDSGADTLTPTSTNITRFRGTSFYGAY